MTTERLEELAAKCAVAIDGVGRNASYGLSDSDLRDLARCALAWAKSAAILQAGVEISLAQAIGGEIQLRTSQGLYVWKSTPIEAVEAAEVGQ